MATITRLKRSADPATTTLSNHASSALAVPGNPLANPAYAGLAATTPRPGLTESKAPTNAQATLGELCIGMYEEDPAIYFQDSVGQIIKIAQISHEEQAGQIEIATQAETDGGIDDFRSVTPLKLSNFGGTFRAPTVTFGQSVLIQGDATVNGKFKGNTIATQSEADGITRIGIPLDFIDDKLLTPKKLLNFGGTLTGGVNNLINFDTQVIFDDTAIAAQTDVTVKVVNKLFAQNYDIESLPDLP